MRPPPATKSPLVVRGHSISNPSYQPAGKRPSTTTMKRSGSIGNLPRATIVPAQRGHVHSATVEDHQIPTTSCALHSIPRESLPEKYARSLEQQIHLPELENNYLKRGQPTLADAAPVEVEHKRYGKILSRGGNEEQIDKISLGQSTWEPTNLGTRRVSTTTGCGSSPETDRFTIQQLTKRHTHGPDAELLQ